MSENTKTQRDEPALRDIYKRRRDVLIGIQNADSQNADKTVITVSTAALGFSLAFIKDVIPIKQAIFLYFLYLSWFSFVLAIICIATSFLFNKKAIEIELERAEDDYKNDNDKPHPASWQAKTAARCSNGGIVLLCFGLIITCIFVGLNFNEFNLKGTNMSDKSNPKNVNSIGDFIWKEKSAPIPSAEIKPPSAEVKTPPPPPPANKMDK